jgi:MoxR-like ATPase
MEMTAMVPTLANQTPPREDVQWWIENLARVGYFIAPEMARDVAFWWQSRLGPLVLEGPPGGGKTRLAEAIVEVCQLQNSFYRLQCYSSIGKQQALYDWDSTIQRYEMENSLRLHDGRPPGDLSEVLYSDRTLVPGQLVRALLDENPDTLLLIDEFDKIPPNQAFEALALQFLGEHSITISEQNRKLRPRSALAPHTVITSNAGVDNSSVTDQLSSTILRRAVVYVNVPEPTAPRRYMILRTNARSLSPEVIRDAVLLVDKMSQRQFDKPVALSETINWVKYLEFLDVRELTADVVISTASALAKIHNDVQNLKKGARAAIESVRNRRKEIDIEACERELAEGRFL